MVIHLIFNIMYLILTQFSVIVTLAKDTHSVSCVSGSILHAADNENKVLALMEFIV